MSKQSLRDNCLFKALFNSLYLIFKIFYKINDSIVISNLKFAKMEQSQICCFWNLTDIKDLKFALSIQISWMR